MQNEGLVQRNVRAKTSDVKLRGMTNGAELSGLLNSLASSPHEPDYEGATPPRLSKIDKNRLIAEN